MIGKSNLELFGLAWLWECRGFGTGGGGVCLRLTGFLLDRVQQQQQQQ